MSTLALDPAPKTAGPLFIGLQSYTEAQASLFFGRDNEIDRLTNLIKANTLTIVFGKSGTGKTSLLNAGVFPRLRKDYCLPFRIRLAFDDNSPGLVTQIKTVLKTEIDKYGFHVESYPGNETLWEYFHREPLWRSITPILIFDQFEEIFTLAKKNTRFDATEIAPFWEELADLIENSIPEQVKDTLLDNKDRFAFSYKAPKAKVLFSFREEYLPEFESIAAKIPSLKYSRFRLLPMNGNQAYEVVTKTWKSSISAAQADKIVEFFSSDDEKHQAYEAMTIEPALLSQVCSLIDRERIKEKQSRISPEFLNRYSKEFILRSIYDDVLAESNAAVGTAYPPSSDLKPINVFVEDRLITDEGYRTRYTTTEHDEHLRPGINVLKGKYFVRGEGSSIELTHDVLTPLIKRDREERRKAAAFALAKRKAKRRSALIVGGALLTGLAFWFFWTKKAFDEEKQATQNVNALNRQIDSAKATLATIDSTIKAHKEPTSRRKPTGGSMASTITDSTAQAYVDSLIAREQALNLLLAALTSQRTDLQQKLGLQGARFADFRNRQQQVDAANKEAIRLLRFLQNQKQTDSFQLAWYKENYDKLRAEYEAYRRTHPFHYPPEPEPPAEEPADTSSLKLDLHYSLPKDHPAKVPGNLKVYLIPVIPENKKIIRRARNYQIFCNDLNLDAAKGKQVAKYVNGQYTFFNVPAGNQQYFVKICDYYGGFYTLQKTKPGNEIVSLEAAPPIR